MRKKLLLSTILIFSIFLLISNSIDLGKTTIQKEFQPTKQIEIQKEEKIEQDPFEIATDIVRNIEEVQEWIELLENQPNAGEPIIQVEEYNKNIFTIRVYELKETHQSTFNWYEVDIESQSAQNATP
jgi:sensor domain CHASE-containing protein